jgi:hypothetical protein
VTDAAEGTPDKRKYTKSKKPGRKKKRGKPDRAALLKRQREQQELIDKLQADLAQMELALAAKNSEIGGVPEDSPELPIETMAETIAESLTQGSESAINTSSAIVANNANQKAGDQGGEAVPRMDDRYYIPPEPIEVAGVHWERQANEPIGWYLRFVQFIEMPRPSPLQLYRREELRTRLEARYNEQNPMAQISPQNLRVEDVDPENLISDQVRQIQTLPGHWKTAIRVFRWQERYNKRLEHRAAEANELWKRRSEQFREEAWSIYQEGLRPVRDMLRMPIAQKRLETEHSPATGEAIAVTIIEPVRWTIRDVSMLLARVFEVGGLAVGDYGKALTVLMNAGYDIQSPDSAVIDFDNPEQVFADVMNEIADRRQAIGHGTTIDIPSVDTGLDLSIDELIDGEE